MNSSSTPDSSLYQLTQQSQESPKPITVRVKTFQALVKTLIIFLKEQAISAQLWVKLPTTPQWLSEIESYHQSGQSREIYLCQVSKGASTSEKITLGLKEVSNSRMIPLLLEASSQLKREYFLIIISQQFCCLLLAVKPPNLGVESSVKGTSLKLIYDVDPELIQKIVSGIKQGITITDTTPESLWVEKEIGATLPLSFQGKLVGSLLRQQIVQMEGLSSTDESETDLGMVSGKLSPMISFNEEFIRDLTRELSVPLTNLKTALSLLDSMQHKREQRGRYLEMLQRECDRQNALLSSVQELIQSNQPVPEADVSVKLEEVIPGIVSTYQPLAEEKGIFLGYTIPAGLPPVICPRQWLGQMLRHLLHNSLKFTDKKGRIQVQAALKNEMVALSVTDTGIGIESGDLPRIYQSFYKGRNTIPDTPEGVGLGLTLVKSLVEGCGGAIAISSQIRKGTIVTLTLPIIAHE